MRTSGGVIHRGRHNRVKDSESLDFKAVDMKLIQTDPSLEQLWLEVREAVLEYIRSQENPERLELAPPRRSRRGAGGRRGDSART